MKINLIIIIILLITGCSNYSKKKYWKALHLLHYNNDEKLNELELQIPSLAEMGINRIILEVDYHFDFKTHPELRQTQNPITVEGAKNFTKLCRKNGIEIIPLFQCVGHQSWAEETFKLLEVYPELDLTPNAFQNNKGIYCREWDVLNPKVNEIVFPLMGEIIDAFDAKALHVGMDEVFLLGSDQSPSTKGKDPAKLYAKAVNEIYEYLRNEKNVEMLMWGDRLIDASKINYGEWESSKNGTASAIDIIPKDIIICDWHYENLEEYTNLQIKEYSSVKMFLNKGFRVLPTSWKKVESMSSLLTYSLNLHHPKMLGHLFTVWSILDSNRLVDYPPMKEGVKILNQFSETNK